MSGLFHKAVNQVFKQTMNLVSLKQTASSILLAVFCAVLMSGCATAPQPEVVISDQARQQLWSENRPIREQISNWQLTGRMGLRVPGESGTLSLEWQQDHSDYKLYLDGPLGTSVARIEGSQKGVRLWADGKEYQGRNPEALLFQMTGWDLPVSLLRYWILGIPAPLPGFQNDSQGLRLNNQGLAERISQNGWQVEYLAYRDFKGLVLPSRLKVSRGEVKVTLSVRSWGIR